MIRVCLSSFFILQNSFIGYDVLNKLAIPQPRQYLQVTKSFSIVFHKFNLLQKFVPKSKPTLGYFFLTICPFAFMQSRYPDGIQLDNVFVHPSMVEMLDAAVQDAIEHGNW